MQPWQAQKTAARYAASDGLDARWIREKTALILGDCHPKQRAFVEDPHRRVNARVGRGGGKTTGGKARFLLRMLSTPRARCIYIALTRPSAEELLWAPLKDTCEKLGLRSGIDVSFNETKLKMTLLRNGATLRLVGADDKREIEKLRGQPFHEVGIDEAGSFPPQLLRNLIERIIGPRLGDYDGVLWMISTPSNMLTGEFYDATRPGSDQHRPYDDRGKPEWAGWLGWSSHFWTLLDGAPYVQALANLWREALIEKAAKGWSDDHPVWRREFLGEWSADNTENVFRYTPFKDGVPWNQWDPPRVGALQFAKLPDGVTDWEYAFGCDMGHSDPFALNVFAFSPSDTTRTIYHVYCFEQRKMYARTIAQLLIGEELDLEHPRGVLGHTAWPIGMVADLAGLGDAVLDELANVYGIRMTGAEKKSKFASIELFNGDLVDGRIKVLKGSHLEDQLLSLQWSQDEWGKLMPKKGEADHSADSAIYARRLIAHLFDTGKVAPAVIAAKHPRDAEPEEPTERASDDYSAILAEGSYGESVWGD